MKTNLTETIYNSIRDNWESSAMADFRGDSVKYSDIAEKILSIHNKFKALKIKRGDKIALLGKNTMNWAVTYLSVITYGAVIVPILPDFKPNDIHHIINHSDSVLLFTSELILESVDETKIPDINAVFSLSDFDILICNKKNIEKNLIKADEKYRKQSRHELTKDNFRPDIIENSENACISYTSGTTGFSKGVIISHKNLVSNLVFAQHHMPLQPKDKILSFLPLAHAYGCAFEFLFPFSVGCFITFLGKTPSPRIIVKAFSEVKPNLILSVPLIIEKIYKKQIKPLLNSKKFRLMTALPPVKKLIYKKIKNKLTDVFGGNFHEIVVGGAAINKEVEFFLREIKFPFTSGYGMTECAPLISYSGWKVTRFRSVGKAVDRMEVRIDSPDPHNIVGEILVKGVNVFKGYYKNPEITAETIDREGWLHTGDMGIIDKEGFIYIKGRSKNMILGASGQNIYPEELEARLNNLPYVNESLVVDRKGKLIALVYPDLDLVDQEEISEKELKSIMEKNRKLMNQEFPSFSSISRIDIYPEEFEKTATKKIKRFLYAVND